MHVGPRRRSGTKLRLPHVVREAHRHCARRRADFDGQPRRRGRVAESKRRLTTPIAHTTGDDGRRGRRRVRRAGVRDAVVVGLAGEHADVVGRIAALTSAAGIRSAAVGLFFGQTAATIVGHRVLAVGPRGRGFVCDLAPVAPRVVLKRGVVVSAQVHALAVWLCAGPRVPTSLDARGVSVPRRPDGRRGPGRDVW